MSYVQVILLHRPKAHAIIDGRCRLSLSLCCAEMTLKAPRLLSHPWHINPVAVRTCSLGNFLECATIHPLGRILTDFSEVASR